MFFKVGFELYLMFSLDLSYSQKYDKDLLIPSTFSQMLFVVELIFKTNNTEHICD